MGNGYYDEKAAQRQRICYKCLSFVTHDKVDDTQLACPLCGNRINTRPTARVAPISDMIIEHFFVAKSSAVDSDTNSLSVFELVEDLTVQIASKVANPQAFVSLQIIAIIKRTGEVGGLSINCRFAIEDPSGKLAVEQDVPIVIESNFIRFRARLNFPLLLKSPGVYRFKICVDNDPALVKVLESNIIFADK